jgi:NADPH:quinone reductase-like Zn-dependent oxidoreductase
MKAIVYREYGSAEVLSLREIDRPAVKDDEVLLRVHAVSLNPLDWHFMRGRPYVLRLMGSGLRTPGNQVLGVDLAGTVEKAGRAVKRLAPGDEVFGSCKAALAEYACGRESRFVPKPANLTFEEAAAVPTAAITALQGLRDRGETRPGHEVLIIGASGGVGTFAVQIAKTFDAQVTAVCSTRNVDLVRSIGADHVIDYTREDFADGRRSYDVIFDGVGSRSLADCRRALRPGGILVLVGGPNGPMLGGLTRFMRAWALSPFVRRRSRPFISTLKPEDLLVLRQLMEDGEVTPVLDGTYDLSQAPEAIRHLEGGHARGKVVITLVPRG